MSIIVERINGTDAQVVPLNDARTVKDLMKLLRIVQKAPLPEDAYSFIVHNGQSHNGLVILPVGENGDRPLADIGIHGCEERVSLRAKDFVVAQETLANDGVITEADARQALQAAVDGRALDRVHLIVRAGLTSPLPHLSHGDEEVVRCLLDAGAAEQITQAQLDQLLRDATQRVGHARMYIDHGADLQEQELLRFGMLQGHVDEDFAMTLIEKGADVHTKGVLPIAAGKGYPRVVHALLDRGADVHTRDGELALANAVRNGCVGVVHELIDRGADISAKDTKGNSILAIAVERKHLNFVRILLTAGADADANDRRGNPALCIASAAGDGETVTCLLEAGANVHAGDKGGVPAIVLAKNNGHDDVVALLAKWGATVPVWRRKRRAGGPNVNVREYPPLG